MAGLLDWPHLGSEAAIRGALFWHVRLYREHFRVIARIATGDPC
jgi:hypothetical protein